MMCIAVAFRLCRGQQGMMTRPRAFVPRGLLFVG